MGKILPPVRTDAPPIPRDLLLLHADLRAIKRQVIDVGLRGRLRQTIVGGSGATSVLRRCKFDPWTQLRSVTIGVAPSGRRQYVAVLRGSFGQRRIMACLARAPELALEPSRRRRFLGRPAYRLTVGEAELELVQLDDQRLLAFTPSLRRRVLAVIERRASSVTETALARQVLGTWSPWDPLVAFWGELDPKVLALPGLPPFIRNIKAVFLRGEEQPDGIVLRGGARFASFRQARAVKVMLPMIMMLMSGRLPPAVRPLLRKLVITATKQDKGWLRLRFKLTTAQWRALQAPLGRLLNR